MPSATPRQLIREHGEDLAEVMRAHLGPIAESFIQQIINAAKRLPRSRRLDAINGLQAKGVAKYREALTEALVLIAQDGLASARAEVPAARNVTLAKKQVSGRLEDLPRKLQEKIITRQQLLIGKQIGDLQSLIEFTWAANEDTDEDPDQWREDLSDSAVGWLEGTSMELGAAISSATTINDSRNAFFYDDQVLGQIDAFEFMNGDPVSDICQDLAGTVFATSDPDAFRYTPPLHWNCKSWIRPILKGNLGSKEIEKLKPSTKELDASIQFSERTRCGCPIDHSVGWSDAEVRALALASPVTP